MAFSLANMLSFSAKRLLRFLWRRLNRFSNWLILQSKISRIRIKRIFFAPPIPVEAGGSLNLHLGCGNIDHKEFINIDGYPHPHVHYVQNIGRLPQFKDCSVDLIYASHCLEHFFYAQTSDVLKEWQRVLRKGGILRLSIPDFDKLVEIYGLHHQDPDVILPQLMGGQDNVYNFHYTALNIVNLSRLLRSAGFSRIELWQPGSGNLTTFDDFSTYKKEVGGRLYEVSLNIEAIK
jgi:predicted SAM-dependent methyltransferase